MAAHLVPVASGGSDAVSNGLLLRSDLHTLFDLNLIGIRPGTRELVLAPGLLASCYYDFQGRLVRETVSRSSRLDETALMSRWIVFLASR